MVRISDQDASWTPPCGGVPGMFNWEETGGQPQNTLEELHIASVWEQPRFPQDKLEDMVRNEDIWAATKSMPTKTEQ